MKLLSREMTVTRLIILAGLVFLLFYNWAFFQKVVEIYPLTTKNAGFLASLALMLWAFFVFLMSLVCYRRTVKPVLVFFLLLSSFAAYFMDTYGVIIDDSMLRNVMKTDLNESLDLLSLRMVLYFFLLGLLPVVLVMAVRLRPQSLRQAVKQRLLLSLGSLFTGVALIFAFGSTYASFFREHKPLRYYTNPSYYIYSTIKVARQELDPAHCAFGLAQFIQIVFLGIAGVQPLADTLDTGDTVLDDAGNPALYHIGGCAAVDGIDRHHRWIDVRVFAQRQAIEGHQAESDQQQRHHRG